MIRAQYRHGPAAGFNRAQVGNRHAPLLEKLKSHRLKSRVGLIYLVNQQNTGLLAEDRPEKWAGGIKAERIDLLAQARPLGDPRLCGGDAQVLILQGTIKVAQSLSHANAFITLQAL